LVETVTSGEVVTMRRASSLSVLAMASRILPNAVWVEVAPVTDELRSQRRDGRAS
jgi:hypothetical protein